MIPGGWGTIWERIKERDTGERGTGGLPWGGVGKERKTETPDLGSEPCAAATSRPYGKVGDGAE